MFVGFSVRLVKLLSLLTIPHGGIWHGQELSNQIRAVTDSRRPSALHHTSTNTSVCAVCFPEDGAMCSPDGGCCRDASDCCEGGRTCTSNLCEAPAPTPCVVEAAGRQPSLACCNTRADCASERDMCAGVPTICLPPACVPPACGVAGGACQSNGSCCDSSFTCVDGVCTPPPCTSAGEEKCACDVSGGNDQCNGELECAQFGPLRGTCQVSYAVLCWLDTVG